ncbi:pyrimidine-nucleoside phosphorylase [Vulcanibacillus modesticaldus]|uniref:Pyrimidine-nucleoside phosphorylase n=1 Tax=Vulcanibacillus modesticaldus TaxID=337097 RepID=A0A1D2YSD4_9BACI|nr:pyrimidine-nucleoside phosphorylase [Vulcanibacillus modesticaldus]OEF97235.1 pyrimidine-nucleoside phosphorylase [Vulcanibacillus modesticaldus]
MRMVDLIHKKREGQELTTEEINFIIDGYSRGAIPDYQLSAFTMAVFYQGMTERETADLTLAMVESGEQIDLSKIEGIKVDKHSTGGVGDTTTLVLGPLVATAGVPVAKMSGRGLGHTGGTIDKLESIEGFHVELNNQEFIDQVNKVKLSVIGQTANLTPADKKLYALRDVTATVDSIPLIASSIMSKKIAAGADAIVLDVKTGDGAFMKTTEKSFELAKAMVDIGTLTKRNTVAVVSDMDQPLGFAVGNALEVKEAIETLKGNGPKDLEELCLVLGSHMLVLGEKAKTVEEAYQILEDIIHSGKAIETLKEFVKAQGGNPDVIDNPDLLPQAEALIDVIAEEEGFVHKIHAEEIGISAMMLGAGRETKESEIDLAVGIKLNKKVGDRVDKGDVIATLYVNNPKNVEEVKRKVLAAYTIGSEKLAERPLIFGIVTKDGIQKN